MTGRGSPRAGPSTSRTIRTFRLGSPRGRDEGLRIGAVRFLPRGVAKQDYAGRDYFDVWLPLLAPSRELLEQARTGAIDWRRFAAAYEREMKATDARQAIELVAALAGRTPLAVGCFCEDESRCHRSLLRQLIERAMKA